MQNNRRFVMGMAIPAVICLVGGCASNPTRSSANPGAAERMPAAEANALPMPSGFTSAYAQVNGVRLHYWIGGKPSNAPTAPHSAVVLLHGYAETSHMWRPLMQVLAQNHVVIVPDLRGAGDSGKPESGYDKKNMAVDIHELTFSLGFNHV